MTHTTFPDQVLNVIADKETSHLTGADIFEGLESNVRSYCRNFTDVFQSAEGSTLTSETGKVFVDFFSGAGALNYGHNHPVLKSALIEYIAGNGISHALDFKTTAKQAFLETFERIILQPRRLHYKVQFPGPTGTNAVEAAIKLARKYTGRQNILAFTNAFHGMSLGALALTSNPRKRAGAGVPLGQVSFMPYQHFLGPEVDTTQVLERMLSPGSGVDKPAAIILETVQGEGGVNAASAPWVRRVADLARAAGIVLIVDDIQAGCGRTGEFFSFEALGITPDIVTLSKSISGYGLPMSLVLLAPELDVWEPGEHNGTFRGNSMAFVTARATLEHFWGNAAFCSSLEGKAQVLHRRLTELVDCFSPTQPCVVKGRGFFKGIEFQDKTLAGKLSAACYRLGMIIETSGVEDHVLKFLPALTMTDEERDNGFSILRRAFESITD